MKWVHRESVQLVSLGRHTHTLVPYLGVDLVKQGEEKCVEVSEEEGKDASELPLEGNSRMVVLQLSDGLK